MHHFSRGMTLVETIMMVALTAAVLMVLASLIQYFYKTNAFTLHQSQAVQSARTSIEHSMRDIREASYGADGSYPVSAAATSSITFFANIDNDSAVEKVRYYLSNTTLYRGITDPNEAASSYAGQPEVNTLVVNNIRNGTSTPLFTYFDANGTILTDPVNVALISSVRTSVRTDVDPERAPLIYELSGSATLRNIYNMNTQ